MRRSMAAIRDTTIQDRAGGIIIGGGQQGQTSDIQIYGSWNTVGLTQGQGQDGGY